jgi:DNA-binding transcriptional regulator GbsR (MarR family)
MNQALCASQNPTILRSMKNTNTTSETLTEAQLRFLDDLARLLAEWNMPANASRVYGYLLMKNEAASLDDMRNDLGISKSNACGAAKILEQWGHTRRTRNPSTKRVYYEINENHGVPFSTRSQLLEAEAALMRASKAEIATGKAAERLEQLADFCEEMKNAMDAVITKYAK